MRRNHPPLLCLVILCWLLPGCLDYREVLQLNADGSGTLQMDFVVDLALLGEISAILGEEPDPEAMKGPSEEEVREGLEAEGITIEELKIQRKETKSKIHVRLRFKDVAALNRIRGFGDDRRIEFFDNGDGRVRVVYSFDTNDVLPIEELSAEEDPKVEPDPIEQKIMALTQKARDSLKFRAKIRMPGPILKSNGIPDPELKSQHLWIVDKKRDPKRHAVLGRGRIRMNLLVARESLPFVKVLKPLPAPRADKKKPPPPSKPGR